MTVVHEVKLDRSEKSVQMDMWLALKERQINTELRQ